MNIVNRLTAIVKQMKVTFTFKGNPLTHSELFSDTGLLPGLVRRAEQLASLCFGYGLGASFEDVEQATLGVKVSLDEFTPDALRLFCILDVLYELIKSSPTGDAVSLDELMYD